MIDQPNCSEIVTEIPIDGEDKAKSVLKRAMDLIDATLCVELWIDYDKIKRLGIDSDKISSLKFSTERREISVDDIKYGKGELTVKDGAIELPPSFVSTSLGLKSTGVWMYARDEDVIGFEISEWDEDNYEDFAKVCSDFNTDLWPRGGNMGDFIEYCEKNDFDVHRSP